MILNIDSISKTYKQSNKKALIDFTAELTPGVYGLLGPNGAGKSTLMNIITDNIRADSGSITYSGQDILKLGKEFRTILGYMPQQQGIYDKFTATDFLWYMASLKGMKRKEAKDRIQQVLSLVNLEKDAKRKLGAYSGGMKQRILMAQAILNDPEILILDEPTAGLDPKERIRIRNFISEIALNKIVILATHVVSDIECIAKENILIRNGELLAKDTPENILATMKNKVWQIHIDSTELTKIQKKYIISNLLGEDNGKIAVKIISENKPEEYESVAVLPSLEDMYLYMFRD